MPIVPRALATAALMLAATAVVACGSAELPGSSAPPASTPASSPTSLFPSGGIISSVPSVSSKPVLVISQFNLQMTFSPQLGTVTYAIDPSQNGTKRDQGGTQFTVNGTISLATARYAAMPCASDSPVEASVIVATTSASSLNLNGPTAWVSAGSYLLGFTPGQSTCALGEQNTEIPLLQQMVQSAASE